MRMLLSLTEASAPSVGCTDALWCAGSGCTVGWLPGAHDFSEALVRLGFQPPSPGPRILNPRGVHSVPAALPLQSGSMDTPAGGTPGTGLPPTPGGSSQRPRRGRRGAPAAPAPPPAVPLHNLRLLLRSMEVVLRRDKVCPSLARPRQSARSAMPRRVVAHCSADLLSEPLSSLTLTVWPAPCTRVYRSVSVSNRQARASTLDCLMAQLDLPQHLRSGCMTGIG